MTQEEWLDRLDNIAAYELLGGQAHMSGSGKPWRRPTRSISDAWKLVEKMEADGWEVLICTERGWSCEVHKPEECKSGFAPTAPLAISLCALRVVGAEIPEEPSRE